MAIVSVVELDETPARNRWERVFRVTTSGNVKPQDVLAATGVPALGEPFPGNAGLAVSNVKAVTVHPIDETENEWRVTVAYEEAPRTCKTCKWWGHGQDRPYPDSTPAKRCGNPKLVDIEEERSYAAVKGDGFGLDYPVCDLVTGPDFGCVHYERKEAMP